MKNAWKNVKTWLSHPLASLEKIVFYLKLFRLAVVWDWHIFMGRLMFHRAEKRISYKPPSISIHYHILLMCTLLGRIDDGSVIAQMLWIFLHLLWIYFYTFPTSHLLGLSDSNSWKLKATQIGELYSKTYGLFLVRFALSKPLLHTRIYMEL